MVSQVPDKKHGMGARKREKKDYKMNQLTKHPLEALGLLLAFRVVGIDTRNESITHSVVLWPFVVHLSLLGQRFTLG
jgi:hypothetical protein